MDKGSKKESLTRVLILFGGVMTLVFGLLTAFIPGLAYVFVDRSRSLVGPWTTHVAYLSYNCQFHDLTIGMLISSVGGLLGLISSLRRDNKLVSLSFAGASLGVLGFLSFSVSRFAPTGSFYSEVFRVPWVGAYLTLTGVSVMFMGSAARYKGRRGLYLTLLGILPLLTSYLVHLPLIVNNNLSPLVSRSTDSSLFSPSC